MILDSKCWIVSILRSSKIKLGHIELELDVVVTENLHEGFLLGLDFLTQHPLTSGLIEQLQDVAKQSTNEVNEVHTFTVRSQEER